MPVFPWTTIRPLPADTQLVAVLTTLPLQSYWAIPRFLGFTRQVQRHLQDTPGLIGYSLLGRPWERQFCLLSVWENEQAVTTFIDSPAHRTVLRTLQPEVGPIGVIRWPLSADEYPPPWPAALAKAALQRQRSPAA